MHRKARRRLLPPRVHQPFAVPRLPLVPTTVHDSQAREAAGGKDVALSGGASIAQQYLKAGLIDKMQIHLVPVLLRAGAQLFDDLADTEVGLECTRAIEAPGVTHLTYSILN